jgi:aspartate/methionine/tyrosine aminotransferase
MKLAWIAVSGEGEAAREASARLEHVADTYLPVSTPVAVAAGTLLELAPEIASAVSARTRKNLELALEATRRRPSVSILPPGGPEGGWNVVLRLPAVRSSEEWALEILEEASVYVHPGSFFGFGSEIVLVASLLTRREVFGEGLERLLRVVSDRIDWVDA